MSIIGIVSEFNPFHNGHKYLIDAVKADGDIVVCVMSGNFTQRAEPSIFPKQARAEAALKNGADIVLELPFLYATATAELFAKNAVRILCEFGCDTIAFGAECEDTELLIKAAELMCESEFDIKIKENLQQGTSYPVARQKAFEQYAIDLDISTPNNILAIEYIKAVLSDYPEVKIKAVKRTGAEHDSDTASGEFASASYIREQIIDDSDYKKFVPENAALIYEKCKNEQTVCDYDKYEIALMSILRSKEISSGVAYTDSELASRIDKAINSASTLEELYTAAKTKHYTHSRVRRAVLCRAFEISENDIKIPAPYVRLLGFNVESSSALGALSKACNLPVVGAYSDIKSIENKDAQRVFELESKSTDIYNLCNKASDSCSREQEYMIVKAK